MKKLLTIVQTFCAGLALSQDKKEKEDVHVLFTNVSIFDGVSENLLQANVLTKK